MFLRSRNGNGTSLAEGSDSDAIIYAHQVVKMYDTGTSKVQALESVDFAVRRGELVGVMGPSGCGKTTLLNCLSGLDDVDSGQIWADRTVEVYRDGHLVTILGEGDVLDGEDVLPGFTLPVADIFRSSSPLEPRRSNPIHDQADEMRRCPPS